MIGFYAAGAMGQGSGPSPSGHRYWRVYITATGGSVYASITEIEFRGSVGGSDMTSPSLAGARSFSSTNFGGNPANLAFDDNFTTGWASNGNPMPQYIGWDFNSPVAVAEFAITRGISVYGVTNRWPTEFDLQYSDDNSSWTTARSVLILASSWQPGVSSNVTQAWEV